MRTDATLAGRLVECCQCGRIVPAPGFCPDEIASGVFSPEFLYIDAIFPCPACSVRVRADIRLAGTMVNCPDCNAAIRFPALSKSASPREQAPLTIPNLSREEIQFLSGELNTTPC